LVNVVRDFSFATAAALGTERSIHRSGLMRTRPALLVWLALAISWSTGAVLYLYPDVKEEIEEKRYLHRVEKSHTPVLSIDCARARGVENRDFIREDTDPKQCWMTIPAFNALYPEIAGGTDLAATLRSQERENLPLENWDGTPIGLVLWALMIAFGPPAALLGLLMPRWLSRPRAPRAAPDRGPLSPRG
jgi:hypothetical protein